MFDKFKNFIGNRKEDDDEPEHIESTENSGSKPEYLENLFENIENIKESKEVVLADFLKMDAKGFLIKVRGLFAFVPFANMSWSYSVEDWEKVEPYVVGLRMPVQVESIEGNQIICKLVPKYDSGNFGLIKNKEYSCLIMRRSVDYVIVELGHVFKWKYGSLLYYIQIPQDSYVKMLVDNNLSGELGLVYDDEAKWFRTTLDDRKLYAYRSIFNPYLHLPGTYGVSRLVYNDKSELGIWRKGDFYPLVTEKEHYDANKYVFLKKTIEHLSAGDKILYEFVGKAPNELNIRFLSIIKEER